MVRLADDVADAERRPVKRSKDTDRVAKKLFIFKHFFPPYNNKESNVLIREETELSAHQHHSCSCAVARLFGWHTYSVVETSWSPFDRS